MILILIEYGMYLEEKPKTGMSGYLPSSSGAISSTPNLVALQPHFKGHTLYDTTKGDTDGKEDKYRRRNIDEEFKDVEKKNTLQLFTNLNLDSTVNKAEYKKRQRKMKRGDIQVNVIELDVEGNKAKKSKKIVNRYELGKDKDEDTKQTVIDFHENQMQNMEIDSVDKSQDEPQREPQANDSGKKNVEVKLRRPVLEYTDIPLELRSTPMGVLLASYACDTGELPIKDENGQYDWTDVIERYRKLNNEESKFEQELSQTQ